MKAIEGHADIQLLFCRLYMWRDAFPDRMNSISRKVLINRLLVSYFPLLRQAIKNASAFC